MEKSPLLANGYNHPPTHLSHMQFMQLGGHPGAGHTAILSPASLPHHLQAQAQARAEQGLKVNPNMTNIEALARSGTVWENCRAAYEDIVKHLERCTIRSVHNPGNIKDKKEGFVTLEDPLNVESRVPESRMRCASAVAYQPVALPINQYYREASSFRSHDRLSPEA
ncbi:hypothetical protein M0802_011112 [Mischocyttarus mexicanus]|nr:hypothetical protein M0802_011112 [Mischocyttarus mexicanus]